MTDRLHRYACMMIATMMVILIHRVLATSFDPNLAFHYELLYFDIGV